MLDIVDDLRLVGLEHLLQLVDPGIDVLGIAARHDVDRVEHLLADPDPIRKCDLAGEFRIKDIEPGSDRLLDTLGIDRKPIGRVHLAGQKLIAERRVDLLQVGYAILAPLQHGIHRAELARRVLVLMNEIPLRAAALSDDQRLESESGLPDNLDTALIGERLDHRLLKPVLPGAAGKQDIELARRRDRAGKSPHCRRGSPGGHAFKKAPPARRCVEHGLGHHTPLHLDLSVGRGSRVRTTNRG